MKVAGFTIIRNAIQFDFPIKEAILSIEPLCDAIYVGVGQSTDDTRALIEKISPKIVIIDTIWDDTLREGGRVLAVETNKVFQAIPQDYSWCVYIQGDEAIHERYHEHISDKMKQFIDDAEVDGLLFKYLHFYGSYQYIAKSTKWYRQEIRIIKNNKAIYSYRDAQGFRKEKNKKLRVKWLDAYVYHYGYVKDPKTMKEKINHSNRMWHDDKWLAVNNIVQSEFDFHAIDHLEEFQDSHPSVYNDRINQCHWVFEYNTQNTHRSLKEKIKYWVEKSTGWRIGEYKNFKVI